LRTILIRFVEDSFNTLKRPVDNWSF
jgi:hypothetical protein